MSQSPQLLPYKYPPDLEKCKQHRLAMRIFKGIDQQPSTQQCECCGRKVGVPEYAPQCCYDTMKLAYLGPGVPLMFAFIRNSIILLGVLTLVFAAVALCTNVFGEYCDTAGACSGSIFDKLAIINKMTESDYLDLQNYLMVGFVVLGILLMHYFRWNFRKIEDQADDIVTSPSDYALILRRLPEDTVEKDIHDMIEEKRKTLTQEQLELTDNLKVVNVVMAYSMTEYKKVRQENMKDFYKMLDEQKHDQFVPKQLPKLQKTASFAIVIFSKQQSKILFEYKPNICQKLLQFFWTPCIPRSNFIIRGESIAIERAPQPDDIVWENSKISMRGAIIRKTIYSLMAIILLGAGGGAQYGLALAQKIVPQDETTQLLMSTSASVLVSILNLVIELFLVFTSQKERNETLTEYNTVLMVKISMFQFLNTGIFVVLAQFLADPAGFSLTNGLVTTITQVMIINALVPNLLLLVFSYCELVSKIKRCFVQRNCMKMTQLEANKVYQGPEAEIPYKYAYIFKTLWLTAFYASFTPVVVPLSMLGLGLNYLIQKFLFGRSYASPNMISSMVNDSAVEMMEYTLVALCAGQLVVYGYFISFNINNVSLSWAVCILGALGLAVINLLLPMDAINNKLFKMPKDNFSYPAYEKIQQQFEVTYQMTNPGYKCQRKRRRDLFLVQGLLNNGPLGMLFGNNQQDTSKVGLLTGSEDIYNRGTLDTGRLETARDEPGRHASPFAQMFNTASNPLASITSPNPNNQPLSPTSNNLAISPVNIELMPMPALNGLSQQPRIKQHSPYQSGASTNVSNAGVFNASAGGGHQGQGAVGMEAIGVAGQATGVVGLMGGTTGVAVEGGAPTINIIPANGQPMTPSNLHPGTTHLMNPQLSRPSFSHPNLGPPHLSPPLYAQASPNPTLVPSHNPLNLHPPGPIAYPAPTNTSNPTSAPPYTPSPQTALPSMGQHQQQPSRFATPVVTPHAQGHSMQAASMGYIDSNGQSTPVNPSTNVKQAVQMIEMQEGGAPLQPAQQITLISNSNSSSLQAGGRQTFNNTQVVEEQNETRVMQPQQEIIVRPPVQYEINTNDFRPVKDPNAADAEQSRDYAQKQHDYNVSEDLVNPPFQSRFKVFRWQPPEGDTLLKRTYNLDEPCPITKNYKFDIMALASMSVPLAPQSEKSYSSTKEVRKLFKIENTVLKPFTRFEIEEDEC